MSGWHIFLTRPEGRNGAVPDRLAVPGLHVHDMPALALRPLIPPQPIPLPHDYDVVVFVSRYAVQQYVALLSQDSADVVPGWPSTTIAATVGASSARALRQAGIPPERIVHPPADSLTQDSESLLALLGSLPVPLKRALIVRGTQGRDWLGNALSARQVKVDFLPVYERVPAIWPVATTRALTQCLLHQPDRCLFLLTSSEGVRALAGKFESLGMMDAWSRGVFIVIHERIGATLQSVLSPHWSGGGAGRVALCAPDDDAIVDAIQAQLLSAEP